MQSNIKYIELPKIKDLRGNLTFLEDHNQIPFKIERVYWIYDVPGGEARGEHAFRSTTELIIPLAGGFTVETQEGNIKSSFELNETNKGILIPPMTWRKITSFISNSVCLIVTDSKYNEDDYIRDFEEYVESYKELV
ncbi:sugar 3,4-ketoisomerase [Saccharicrinis aurantiacus]|uniref:sugar 3,4-ketoisomerase n=1 Tax=Saccharicrinis aurantiacus TaxID=1849719 RepID=UPI0024909834|nr:FdtA/QdtA family cupin domain-containing protein [Saccharicrinis aurantiacus]